MRINCQNPEENDQKVETSWIFFGWTKLFFDVQLL